MPDFIFAYHGGTVPETEAEKQASMAAWGAWFEEIGEHDKDPGNPVGKSSTVSARGVSPDGGSEGGTRRVLAGDTLIPEGAPHQHLEDFLMPQIIEDFLATAHIVYPPLLTFNRQHKQIIHHSSIPIWWQGPLVPAYTYGP